MTGGGSRFSLSCNTISPIYSQVGVYHPPVIGSLSLGRLLSIVRFPKKPNTLMPRAAGRKALKKGTKKSRDAGTLLAFWVRAIHIIYIIRVLFFQPVSELTAG